MFNSLKEKLKSWLGKPPEEPEKPLEKSVKKPSKKIPKEKKEKQKKKSKTPEAEKKPSKKKLPSDKELKKEAEKIAEEVPEKFNVGELKYEPDIEAIKEQHPDSTEEKKEKTSFFSKLFSKKEKPEVKKEPSQTPDEEKPKTEQPSQILQKEEPPKLITEKPKSSIFAKFLAGKKSISQEDFEEIFQGLEIILLENNVALEVVDKIKSSLSKELVGKEIKKSEISETILNSLKNSISSVLIDSPDLIEEIKTHQGTFTIIFFGVNGTGKTTSIAKLAHLLKKNNISCILAAADTFRAAAIEQLEIHADNLKIPIIKSQYNADPTSVAFEAKKYAQAHNIKCVLIDTAGRMYTKENLLKQMEKIIRVIQPDKKIFVGESIAGNDSIEQAKTFNEAVGIDGIILSKADVDEKGGTPLSVSYVTKKPIYFLGTGQTYNDLTPFKKEIVMKNLGLE